MGWDIRAEASRVDIDGKTIVLIATGFASIKGDFFNANAKNRAVWNDPRPRTNVRRSIRADGAATNALKPSPSTLQG